MFALLKKNLLTIREHILGVNDSQGKPLHINTTCCLFIRFVIQDCIKKINELNKMSPLIVFFLFYSQHVLVITLLSLLYRCRISHRLILAVRQVSVRQQDGDPNADREGSVV